MAQAIVIKSDKKDATKANPRRFEKYTVRFPKGFEQFNDRVTVVFKHIDAQIISRCFVSDDENEKYLSDFRVFEKCVKEVHGLTKIVTNDDGIEESVELTVDEIIHFENLEAKAEEDDTNAMSIIFAVVHDVAQAIIAKSALTEEEEKNLFVDVKPN